MFVAENLYFNMSRMSEIFLDEYPPIAECGRSFARSRFQSALELGRLCDDAHSASAASGGSLDEDRIAGECGELPRCCDFRGFDSRHHRNSCCDCDSPRRDLVAERRHHVRPRPDKNDLRVGGSLREFGTLGEKSVAGMNRVGA